MNKFMQFIRITLLSIFVLLVASCEVGVDDFQKSNTVDKVRVDSHSNNAIVKSSPIEVSGQVDINNATVVVNGVEAEVNDGQFLASVSLNEGVNSIDVVAQNDSERSVANIDIALNTTQMCGTGETFTVSLPGLSLPDDPSTKFLADNRLTNDSIILPKGCSIYAVFVHGYARNGELDELMFYNLAKFVAENNGYVHWSWWNNFLGEYMGRPLHANPAILVQPEPGNLVADGFAFGVRDGASKAVPDEDKQFQSDAKRVLVAIKRENPDAIIIVSGHSMGGNAVARLGRDTNVDIDLLAPIDPVGNRNSPVGFGASAQYQFFGREAAPGFEKYTPGNETFNWTRWRATRLFRGFKQRDCVRNKVGLCKDFDSRVFHTEYRCINVPVVGWLDEPPTFFSKKPIKCPQKTLIYDRGVRTTFGSNIKRLYHRWQKEATFPYDYKADYYFKHPAKRTNSILGANYQAAVVKNYEGEGNINKTCSSSDYFDPRNAKSFDGVRLLCREWDGHGEIIGMRATVGVATPFNKHLEPLALSAQPLDWPSTHWLKVEESEKRRERLMAMANPGAWLYAPVQPDLDLVVNDMVLITQDILDRGEPGGEDVTPPSSSASLSVEPNDYGWNNTDINVT